MKYLYRGKQKIDIVNLPKDKIVSGIKKPTRLLHSPWISWEDAIKLKKEITKLQIQLKEAHETKRKLERENRRLKNKKCACQLIEDFYRETEE